MYVNGTITVSDLETIISRLKERGEYLKKNTRIAKRDIDGFFLPSVSYGHENPADVERLAKDIQGLLSAMATKRSVFFILEKYPRGGLENGRNWYSLYYTNEEGRNTKFWPHGTVGAALVGMDENNKGYNYPKWLFSSRAIGMDPLLDATGTLCYLLAKVGGFDSCQFTHSDVL